MRFFALTALIGLLVLVGLLYFYGIADIAASVAQIGWGLGLIVLARLAQVAGAALAWTQLFFPPARFSFAACLRLRLVREGINNLLPTGQVGGEFAGARLLAHAGFTAGAACASIIVDVFLQALSQAAFTIAGLAILGWLGVAPALLQQAMYGLLLFIPVLAAFFLAQKFGGFGWVQRRIAAIAASRQWRGLGDMTDLNEQIQRLYQNPRAIGGNFVIHLAIWFAGASEIWLALAFMGIHVSIAEAIILESLTQALRSATFVVPGGLGVQEGGLIALCAVFGLPPATAIAVSLAKRAAELAVGAGGLLIWQAAESRLILDQRAQPDPASLR